MQRASCLGTLPNIRVAHPHIRVERKILGGSPYLVGSRVPVRRVYAAYRSGTPVEKILKQYPQLSPAKIFDAISFALDNPEVMMADSKREPSSGTSSAQRRPKRLPGLSQVNLPFKAARSDLSNT